MSNQTNSQPRGEARKIETRGGINVRDLVNVAVFTVIYLIIFFAFAMAGIVPVMAVFYPLPRRPCGCSAMPTSSPSGHRRAMRSSTAPWRCSAGPCSRSSSSAS